LNHTFKETHLDLNWFLIQGLIKHGFIDASIDLALKSIDMVVKNGLYEAYHSITGKGLGLKEYSISSIILDLERNLEKDYSNIDFIFDREWSKFKRLPDF
jgi:5-methylcytosine-specific restriction endonuclease McrBC regulatory subunit McrC